MTLIEISPYKWGWRVFEAPGVEPVFLEKGPGNRHLRHRMNLPCSSREDGFSGLIYDL